MHSKHLLVLLFAAPLAAQTVRTVGAGQPYPDIASAIAASSAGDIVQVTAGTYGAFTLNKALLVRAEPAGAVVTVFGGTSQPCYFELPAGQSATVEGIDLMTIAYVRPPAGAAAAGAMAFVGTDIEYGLTVQDANAVLRGCVVNGFGTALELTGGGAATATQCSFLGRQASWLPNPNGVRAGDSSTLQLGNCQVRGGTNGFHGILAVGNGAVVSGTARTWFVDTDVAAWSQNVIACAAVVNTSTAPVVFERGSAVDNLGNPNSFVGPVANDLVLGLTSTDQMQVGQPFAIDFRTRPGYPVFVHATFFLQAPTSYQILAQPEWGFVPNSIYLGSLVADAQGLAPYSVVIPNLPFLHDMQLWFCGWSATELPVQLAPVLGGAIR